MAVTITVEVDNDNAPMVRFSTQTRSNFVTIQIGEGDVSVVHKEALEAILRG